MTSATKPFKNQIAFWEKMVNHGDKTGIVYIDIDLSTVHIMTLIGDVSLQFLEIDYIPDDSFISLSILLIGNGVRTVTLPSNCLSTSGAVLSPFIPNTKLALQLFSIDKGISWQVSPFATHF